MATKKKSKRTPTKKPKANAAELRAARVQSLSQVFAALGAREPEQWARSHVDNGVDELGRFVLLRALWMKAVEPGRLLARARKDKTAQDAIDRVMKKVDLVDLDALVRATQELALKDVLGILDDPARNDDGIGWAVFRTDAKGMPLWPLPSLAGSLEGARPR